MLTRYQVASELSVAYLHAIAAKTSFAIDIPHVDSDSVDAVISAKGKVAPDSIKHSPRIEVQLKATINAVENKERLIPYLLSIKKYDDLRADTVLPRLLVLLALPRIENEWLIHQTDRLILQKCAYFLNLKGLSASPNMDNQTVYIPSSNILTPDVLRQLMIKASKLEDL